MKRSLLLSVCVLALTFAVAQTGRRNFSPPASRLMRTAAISPTENSRSIYNPAFRNAFWIPDRSSHLKSTAEVMQAMDSLIYEELNYSSGLIENNTKDEFHYASNGMLDLLTEYLWDPDAARWTGSYKAEYFFEASSNPVQELDYSWDAGAGTWLKYSKDDFSYNNQGYPLLATGYLWDQGSGTWQLSYKVEYSYPASGVTIISYSWDALAGQWLIMSKNELQYNSDGNLVSQYSFYYDAGSGDWVNLGKVEYTYNGSGVLIHTISSFWDSGNWNLSRQEQFSYLPNGDMSLHTYLEWDSFSNTWSDSYKEENEFDTTYAFAQLLIPELFESNEMYFNHMLTRTTGYMYSGLSWDMDGKMTFYYSPLDVTRIDDIPITTSQVFPNPASEQVKFSWNYPASSLTIELYDVTGKLAVRKTIGNGIPLSLSGLETGLYFYHLYSGNGFSESGKLIRK